jgi:hypothetical protein
MTADAIREAMARAMRPDCTHPERMVPCIIGGCRCTTEADAALAALPVTATQMAEIAAGRAVVVPVEATEAMLEVANRASTKPGADWQDVYRAMIAAAPTEGEP